jgi:glycosyltransferase involved in cell wall biosynthesis
MKIVSIVSYPFLPSRTGGQKGIGLFYKYFSAFHEVTCVTTAKNDPELAKGYQVVNILSNSSFRYIDPLNFFRVRKIIRRKKAGHLIIEHPYYGWLGVMLKWFCHVKLVVHSHNMEGNRWRDMGKWWWKILWVYERFTHRHADYNFFITDRDKAYAIRAFGLDPSRCLTVSFGIEIPGPPSAAEHASAKQSLMGKYGVPESTALLLFNGAFGYAPNREALEDLLFRVNPILQTGKFDYLLLVCGIGIPVEFQEKTFPHVRIIGFVDDLELYLKGCDAFLNPVIRGGGIKTKLVEALGYNLNAISTESGAAGVDPEICNGKLAVCKDHDWNEFAGFVIQSARTGSEISRAFYDQFYWGNIAKRAAEFIQVDG